jgi:hypothetical protein
MSKANALLVVDENTHIIEVGDIVRAMLLDS